MEKLLKLLIEETETLERGYWYSSGYDVQVEALGALRQVFFNVMSRLEEEK